MRAAVAARGAGPRGIFGRTSAATVTSVEDAVARFTAYEAAGVDALFLPGLENREQLDRISAATRLPLILAGCSEKLADNDYLASRRVKVWMAGHQAFNAAVQGLFDAMRAVREGARPSELKNIAPGPVMAKLTRAADYQAATRDFLGG
jgi:carboxyvinyl-carboxyphosphonate phosphorylmutase